MPFLRGGLGCKSAPREGSPLQRILYGPRTLLPALSLKFCNRVVRKNLHQKKLVAPANSFQVFIVQRHSGLVVGVLAGIETAVGPRHDFFYNRHFHFWVRGLPIGGTDASDLDCRRS